MDIHQNSINFHFTVLTKKTNMMSKKKQKKIQLLKSSIGNLNCFYQDSKNHPIIVDDESRNTNNFPIWAY